MFLFKKNNKNEDSYKSAQREDDDFVIVNDGVTQSGWVAVNDDVQYIQQQYQQLQNQQQPQQQQPQQQNSNILPIYQIKQQQLNLEEEVKKQELEQEIPAQQPERMEIQNIVEAISEIAQVENENVVPNIIQVKIIKESNPLVELDQAVAKLDGNNNNESLSVVPTSAPMSPMMAEEDMNASQPIIIKSTGKSENNYASPSSTIKPYFTRTTNTSTTYTSTSTSPVTIRGGFTRSSTPTTNYTTTANVKNYISTSKSNDSSYCSSF